MNKKTLFVGVLVGIMMFAMVTAAFATDPTNDGPYTFTESNGENGIPAPSGVSSAGASVWTYQDASDASAKHEGSYNKFDDASGDGTYTTNPHGGYSTTSNKCKTCHAVHRANGTFALMRVDSPDDACNYCHIGSHRHAASEAYFGGSNGIYSSNGHTIGSSSSIPDSSIWQWNENVTLTSADATTSITVRRYLTQRSKIFRYIVHGNRFIRVGPSALRCSSCHQVHNASRQIWQPVASGFLPDADGNLIPAGTKLTNGYKLLRNSPSGGISVGATDTAILNTGSTAVTGARGLAKLNGTWYDPGVQGLDGLASGTSDYRIKALETTINPVTGLQWADDAVVQGSNLTGYTPWKYVAGSNTPSQLVTAMPIVEASMGIWCADCHNLNIAGKQTAVGFGVGKSGDGMLGDRSHVVPGELRQGTVMQVGGTCQQCHNSDMPLDASSARFGTDDCGGCHVTTAMYNFYKNGGKDKLGRTWASAEASGEVPMMNQVAQAARSDFPHSGPDEGSKLLNARDRRLPATASNNWSTNPSIGVEAATGNVFDTQGSAYLPGNGDGQDKVCKTCHSGFKNREIGYDK